MKTCGFALATVFATTACFGIFSSDDSLSVNQNRIEDDVFRLAHDTMLGRRAGSVHELMTADFIRQRFASAGLEPGAEDYFQSFEVIGGKFPVEQCNDSPSLSGQAVSSQNVIGVIDGVGALRSEWVIVGAHYDHMGCTRPDPDSLVVFNGADDNASGTAALLEIARVLGEALGPTGDLADESSRRSIMFIAFGAEELGLVGSQYYVTHPLASLENTVAVVALDMIGRMRNNQLVLINGEPTNGWQTILESKNEADLSLVQNDRLLLRGDHYSFLRAEVPAIGLHTGTHQDYHMPTDDPELIDYEGATDITEIALGVVSSLAFGGRPPTVD